MSERRSTQPIRLDRLTIALILAFLVIGTATAVVAFTLVRNLVASWSMTNLPGVQIKNGTPITRTVNGTPIPQGPLQEATGPTPQPWDGASRVNILLMGLDFRDWEAGEHPRSDSMWLFTVDPVTKTAGMMSIPRDTWVQIPGFDYAKINTAYFLGEAYNLPGGGPGLAVKTVENFIGVPIHFYAQIDFQAFVTLIDQLDGIYLDIPEEIKVDPLGPGNTVVLEPGRQRVFGAVALGYARNRYTGGNDFDRSKRQLQVIMAIRDRVLSRPGYFPRLIAAAPSLYEKISAGIRTNLNLQQAIELAWLIQQIAPENIHHAVIGPNELHTATSPDNLSIEIPIPEKIRLLRDQIFTTGGPLGPAATAAGSDPVALAKAENARISVQHGTSTPGLAKRTADYLKSLGLNVIEETDADDVYGETTIIDYTGKPYTAAYLVNLMHVGPSRVFNRYDPNAQVDVVVIAGNNWAAENPMP
jgi:LCP family protein required for cell wall assembly